MSHFIAAVALGFIVAFPVGTALFIWQQHMDPRVSPSAPHPPVAKDDNDPLNDPWRWG